MLSLGAIFTPPAIRSDDTLWCWGYGGFGELGLGDTTDRTSPAQVGADTWKAVAAGNLHTCAIRSDDTLWCWGNNDSGQLGLDGATDRTAPHSRC